MNDKYYDIDNYVSNKANSEYTIDNVLRNNIGAKLKVNLVTNNNNEALNGILEYVGDNYFIISNPENGSWHLILPIYLNYISFEEPIKF